MCKETKRITPFVPSTLTAAQKQQMGDGMYAMHNFTNHEANERGLATWTNNHWATWKLVQMDEIGEAQ